MKIYEKDDFRLLHPKEWNVDYNSGKLIIEVGNHKISLAKHLDGWVYRNSINYMEAFNNTREMVEQLRIKLSEYYEPKKYLKCSYYKSDREVDEKIVTSTELKNWLLFHWMYADYGIIGDVSEEISPTLPSINQFEDSFNKYCDGDYSNKYGSDFVESFFVVNDGTIQKLSNEQYVELIKDEIRLQHQLNDFYGVLNLV